MTGGRKPQLGEVVAFARAEHDRADDLLGAVVPARLREEPQARAASVLDNVVPFVRPRSNDNARGPELALPATARPAPLTGRPFGITRRAGFVVLSLLVHAATFAGLAFWYIPAPLNGTELEAISVELVAPGSNTPAGQSQTPAENEGVAQSGQVTETPDEKPPVQQAEEPTTEQPQDVKVAEQEAAPEQPKAVEEQTPEPVLAPKEPEIAPKDPEPPREVVETPALAPKEPELAPKEPRESIAMVESPNTPEIATEKPPEVAPEKPVEPEQLTLLPQAPPEEKPVEPPKPELAKPEPKKPEAKKPEPKPKAKERTRTAARTADRTTERPAGPQRIDASNGTGIGAATRANYRGMVSAHLQRHKRYPPDAESRGERGRASVTFSVDGSGRVTSVRLAGRSGYASLDQEVQAMVRRASPFPAPPDGRGDSFTVPVFFGGR